jgi:hypothetical protein
MSVRQVLSRDFTDRKSAFVVNTSVINHLCGQHLGSDGTEVTSSNPNYTEESCL